MQINDEITRHAEALVIRRMDTIDNLAMTAFKGLTIINGGAIVALFALLAQGAASAFVATVDVRLVIWAATAFAVGLVAVMAANILSIFAQQQFHWFEQEALHARHQENAGDEAGVTPDLTDIDRGNRLLVIGGVCSGASLVAFLVGCGLAVFATGATSV